LLTVTCEFCQLPPIQAGLSIPFEGNRKVFASDDVVFARAIGKALLIVIVSFGTLVYIAWAATYQRKNATHVGISNDSDLNHKLPLKRARSCV
jgi:hypothetical protein